MAQRRAARFKESAFHSPLRQSHPSVFDVNVSSVAKRKPPPTVPLALIVPTMTMMVLNRNHCIAR